MEIEVIPPENPKKIGKAVDSCILSKGHADRKNHEHERSDRMCGTLFGSWVRFMKLRFPFALHATKTILINPKTPFIITENIISLSDKIIGNNLDKYFQIGDYIQIEDSSVKRINSLSSSELILDSIFSSNTDNNFNNCSVL